MRPASGSPRSTRPLRSVLPPTDLTRFLVQGLYRPPLSAIPVSVEIDGGSPYVRWRTVLALVLAVAASAVLAVPAEADGSTSQPAQTTESGCYSSAVCTSSGTQSSDTQSQCADSSDDDSSQCAGPISVQDPALTRDLVHDTDPWWLWVAWILGSGSFVVWGFRRPLLRALQAAARPEENDGEKTPLHPSDRRTS